MAEPARRAPGESWRLLLLVGGLALNAIVNMTMVPALPAMATEMGSGYDGQLIAQLVMTVPSVFLVVGGIAASPLVAWLGKRVVLQAAVVAFVLFGMAGMVAPDLPVLFATRLMVGFAAGCCAAIIVSLIGDLYDGVGRARVLGFGAAAAAAATSAIMIMSGWLVDHYGWRACFLVFGTGALLLIPIPRVIGRHCQSPVVRARRAALPIGAILPGWHAYALYILAGVTIYSVVTQGPFLLQARGVESATTQSLILSIQIPFATLSAFCIFLMRRHIGLVPLLLLGMSGVGVSIAAFGLVGSTPLLVAALIMFGAFGGVVAPSFRALVLDGTPEQARTLAGGLLSGCAFAAQVLCPLVFNGLARFYGVESAFTIVGTVCIVAVVSVLAHRLVRAPTLAGRSAE